MTNALNEFQALINQTSTTKGLYSYISKQVAPVDASDLLRWEWVLAVSALDKYIHDVVRIGMVEEFLNRRPKTRKFNTFRIEISTYSNLCRSSSPEIEFEKEIRRQHSFMSIQHPEKLSEALSFIWQEEHKWKVISNNMHSPISEADLKTKLNNIVIRRDQIVHEGDCFMASLPVQQQPISETDTNDVICFITDLVHAIHVLIA